MSTMVTNSEKLTRQRRMALSFIGLSLASLLLLVMLLVVAYPLLWLVMNSFKTTSGIFSDSWGLPDVWHLENYAQAWQMGVSRYFINSLVVTVATTLITLLFSTLCAYGLSRFEFVGKRLLLALISVGLMFPPQVSLIPLYQLIQAMHIYNTWWGLVVPYVAFRVSLIMLLIRAFFINIPKELEEAAWMDGCSSFGVFWRIFLPMSKPILVTSMLLTAYWAWNEFLFAIIFIDDDSVKTITAGLLTFRDALYTNWAVLLAGLVISALPLIVLFLFLQRYFVRGLAEGGVKG